MLGLLSYLGFAALLAAMMRVASWPEEGVAQRARTTAAASVAASRDI
jgi:hypothetical protein